MQRRRIITLGFTAGLLIALSSDHADAAYANYTFKSGKFNYHVENLSISRDGSVIVGRGGTGSATTEMVIFSPNRRTPAWRWKPTGKTIFDVEVSQDGSTIVACGSDVWVFDVATRTVLWNYDVGVEVYDTCTLSQNGQRIFAGSRQSTVHSFQRSSNTPVRTWTVPDEDFVDQVEATEDGSVLLVSSYRTTSRIVTAQDGIAWSKRASGDIVDLDISGNGATAYLAYYEPGSGGSNKVRGFNPLNGATRWTRTIETNNPPDGELSFDGKRLVLSSNDAYYGINGNNGHIAKRFERNGDNSSASISRTGQFFTITEGGDQVYFFDWTYPKEKLRPYRILTDIFPDDSATSANGSTIAYSADDLHVEQVEPGVLAFTNGIPVYERGDTVDLSTHVSNPGKRENLKVIVTLSLPQIEFLTSLGTSVAGENVLVKSKVLDFVQKALPGFRKAYDETFTLQKNSSRTLDTSFEMPNMALPGWVDSVVEGLGLDAIFNAMLGDFSGPVTDLVNDRFHDAMWDRAAEMENQVTYPLIGIGQVQLRDKGTNELYSKDTFFFMYVL